MSDPTDTLARLRATLDAWRERSAEVTVEVRSRSPQGTTTVNADADCAAAFALIDAMIRAAPALLDVAEAAICYVGSWQSASSRKVGYGQAALRQRLMDAVRRLGEVT